MNDNMFIIILDYFYHFICSNIISLIVVGPIRSIYYQRKETKNQLTLQHIEEENKNNA